MHVDRCLLTNAFKSQRNVVNIESPAYAESGYFNNKRAHNCRNIGSRVPSCGLCHYFMWSGSFRSIGCVGQNLEVQTSNGLGEGLNQSAKRFLMLGDIQWAESAVRVADKIDHRVCRLGKGPN